jgi:hypothetical protein
MPYNYDPNLEDDKKRQEAGASATNDQLVSGSPGTIQAGIAGQEGSKPSNSGGSQSGQYTNLQDYLDANKSLQFGSELAGKVQGDVDSAKQGQANIANEFRQAAGQNTVGYDETLANQAKQNAASLDQNQQAQFKNMRDASYKGPKQITDLQDYGQVSQQAQKGAQAGQYSGNEAGQRALLQQYYGRPSYSSGQQNLDQFLVKGDESAKPKFQQAQQQAAQLQPGLQDLGAQLAGEGQQAKATTDATKMRLLEEFLGPQGRLGQFQNELRGTADSAHQAAQNLYTQDQQALAAGQSPFDALKGKTTYNVDPNKYLSLAAQPDYQTTTSKDQANQYQALTSLLGQGQEFLNPELAGTYDPNSGVNFNQVGFDAEQQSAQNAYNNFLASNHLLQSNLPAGYSGNLTQQQLSQLAANRDPFQGQGSYGRLSDLMNKYSGGDQTFKSVLDAIQGYFGANRRLS